MYARLHQLFSMTLQTEILSTVTSDFLKQMVNLNSFNTLLFIIFQQKKIPNAPDSKLMKCEFIAGI